MKVNKKADARKFETSAFLRILVRILVALCIFFDEGVALAEIRKYHILARCDGKELSS